MIDSTYISIGLPFFTMEVPSKSVCFWKDESKKKNKGNKKKKQRSAKILPFKVEQVAPEEHISMNKLRNMKMRKAKLIKTKYPSIYDGQNFELLFHNPIPTQLKSDVFKLMESVVPKSFDIIARGSLPGIKLDPIKT